jgi:hypothetical protein
MPSFTGESSGDFRVVHGSSADSENENPNIVSRYLTSSGVTLYYNSHTTKIEGWSDGVREEIYIKTGRPCSDITMIAKNVTVLFGPLGCHLSHLVRNLGFWVEAYIEEKHMVNASNRRIGVYLTDGKTRYKITKTEWKDFRKIFSNINADLSLFFGDKIQLMGKASSVPVVIKDERDPFEIIAETYGRKKKKKSPKIRRNMTAREEIKYYLLGEK